MLENALIISRLAQYGAAALVAGLPLFFLFASLRQASPAHVMSWPRPLLAASAAILTAATILSLMAQTAVMAGALAEGLKLESIRSVVEATALGKSALVRAVLALLALLAAIVLKPGHTTWTLLSILGLSAAASFAWMGHASATEGAAGWFHLVSDIVHVWAAAIWIGALAGFALMLNETRFVPELLPPSYQALKSFSSLGTLLVALLLATGLINSWFLVGANGVAGLWNTDYGRLLLFKLGLFIGMLALASANRFRLTPALGQQLGAGAAATVDLRALRRSVMVEAVLGFGILAAVAWFGTLPPPANYGSY